MAKKVVGYIKLQVKAGQANPSPPVRRGEGIERISLEQAPSRTQAFST